MTNLRTITFCECLADVRGSRRRLVQKIASKMPRGSFVDVHFHDELKQIDVAVVGLGFDIAAGFPYTFSRPEITSFLKDAIRRDLNNDYHGPRHSAAGDFDGRPS